MHLLKYLLWQKFPVRPGEGNSLLQVRGELHWGVGGLHRGDGGTGDPAGGDAPRLRHHRPHRRRPEQAQRQGPRRISLHQTAGASYCWHNFESHDFESLPGLVEHVAT